MSIDKTIPLMFKARVMAAPDIIAQASKNEKGEFEYFTYKQLYNDVIRFLSVLPKMGLKRGDNATFIFDNYRKWLITVLSRSPVLENCL